MGLLKWLVVFFGFSRKEARGMVVLFGLIVLIAVLPRVILLWPVNRSYGTAGMDAELAYYFSMRDQYIEADPDREVGAETIVYEDFDPNALELEGWMRLGLSERQAQGVLNYRAKGGQFRKKEDLQKMYSISEADYARLEPYIQIEKPVSADVKGVPAQQRYTTRARAAVRVEINSADSIDLLDLPGIGLVFASRIVRYRERLGGFYDLHQLLDVYGMDSARFVRMEPLLDLDSSLVRKIPINQADYELLRSHPMISNKQAALIIRYREYHGSFRSLEDLKQIKPLDEQILRNIAPYLEFY